jgi:hypothetical protein
MTRSASFLKAAALALRLTASGALVIGFGRTPDAALAQRAPAGTPPSSIGEATFDHRLHFKTLAIECKACHHETNAATLKMPHKGYFKDFWIDCSICHKSAGTAAAKPQSCSACHHGSPANIADETLSAKVVIHEKCWECHVSGRGREASNGCVTCHRKAPQGNAVPRAPSASTKKG